MTTDEYCSRQSTGTDLVYFDIDDDDDDYDDDNDDDDDDGYILEIFVTTYRTTEHLDCGGRNSDNDVTPTVTWYCFGHHSRRLLKHADSCTYTDAYTPRTKLEF